VIDKLKIAIVCDWLTVYAGAERVIYEMHQLFPNAPIYTSLYRADACPLFADAEIHESGLRFIPGARRAHRLLFPLMPKVFERMDLSEYDIVISSNHSASKGIITKPETLHFSYCHSPVRYLWDHSHGYRKAFKKFAPLRWLYNPIIHQNRLWDRVAAERVDCFVANSHYISARIKKYYGRDSVVIHPPVDLERFTVHKKKDNYYLAVGRLIPYKRFDLLVQACTEMNRTLKVVGTGPEMKRLKKMAGPKVEFLGKVPDQELEKLYQKAKALIFPQLEDFGIVPLEAMACGTPVIAYGKGGALETVKSGVGGLYFTEQNLESLKNAIHRFERKEWSAMKVHNSIKHFGSSRFKSELRHELEFAWKAHLKMLG
jgi:glycosyltransferase involved in cell wall biosynthesis